MNKQMTNQADPVFQQALEEHKKGHIDQARIFYKQALKSDPEHAEAKHHLGALEYTQGQNDQAIKLLEQAAISLPNSSLVFYNLGLAYQTAKLMQKAQSSFQKAIALNPDFGPGYFKLGQTLHHQGFYIEAVDVLHKATNLNPDRPDIFKELGNCLYNLNRLEEAEKVYKQTLKILPDSPIGLNNLGTVLRELKRFQEAEECYQKALKLKPDYAKARNNLGNILQDQSKFSEAIPHYQKALELEPNYAEAHNNMGNALQELGRFDPSLSFYQKALKLKPDYHQAYYNLGNAHREQAHYEKAIQAYTKALELSAGYIEAILNRGDCEQILGSLDQAKEDFQKAQALNPNRGDVLHSLVHLDKVRPQDPRLSQMHALESQDLDNNQQKNLCFALGKAYHDIEDFDSAFSYYLKGNTLEREEIEYDPDQEQGHLNKLADIFNPELIDKLKESGYFDETPIFIIGMPRSGTTLVEQIISSHPQAYGAGELSIIGDLAYSVEKSSGGPAPFPDWVRQASPNLCQAIGKTYLEKIKGMGSKALRITDKMPGNFVFAGLIHLALPQAKIIHCKRSPADTCLSCFFQLFNKGQNFSYSLEELGRHYTAYHRLMQHWDRVLPQDRILHVQYEDVVQDLESMSKKLVNFCSLTWDQACLDFSRNKRPVRTASVSQVRQPIYTSSVGKWKKYEKHLGPLLKELPEW